MDSVKNRSLDLIIPVFNEALVLPTLLERLEHVFSPTSLNENRLSSIHYIFVDDGSSDATASLISEKIRSGLRATIIRLSRNFGHQAAISAGLDHVRGDLVAIIDADLQDPPELLLDMIKKIDEGYDVVYGERGSREASWPKKAAYWAFYRLLSILCDIRIPVDAGDFCMMKRSVVQALNKLPEKLRFHRGLRSWVGFRHAGVTYRRPARQLGTSKYTFRSLYMLATDGIASLSIRPIRITQGILFLCIFLTLGFTSFTAINVLSRSTTDPYLLWFLCTQVLIAFTGCLQIFCLYILGAYIGRMYLEVKSRPPYIVMELIDSRSPPAS